MAKEFTPHTTIDELVELLESAKQNGATHVGFCQHSDHFGAITYTYQNVGEVEPMPKNTSVLLIYPD